MVKSKDDYDKRTNDSRFEKFDRILDPSYGKKQYYILLAGLIIMGVILSITTSTSYLNTSSQPAESLYENGLNISYTPNEKMFHILFSNPENDTITATTSIKIPFDSQSSTFDSSSTMTPYLTVYEYSTSKFPMNVTYAPPSKVSTLNHIVLVTLIKNTGNYTYTYTVTPDMENKMWEGTGKYLQQIGEILNISWRKIKQDG